MEKIQIRTYEHNDRLSQIHLEKEELKKELDLRDNIITQHKEDEFALKEKIHLLEKELHGVCGDFLFSCRDLKKVTVIDRKLFYVC